MIVLLEINTAADYDAVLMPTLCVKPERSATRVAGAVLGVLLAGTGVLRAEQLALVPSADTSLFERFPTHNLGRGWLAAGTLSTGHRARALLRFDLSAVPRQSLIQGVSLRVTVVRTASGAPGSTFELRRLLKPWGEGAKGQVGVDTGAPATENEATWQARFAPGEVWSEPGGRAGVDFAPHAQAAVAVGGLGAYTFASNAGLVADVQAWVMDPAANFGWLLSSGSEAVNGTGRRFGSRESPADAPVLVIDYRAPPRIDAITRVGDEVLVQFAAEGGRLYAVEYQESLGAGGWTFLANFASKFMPTNAVVRDSMLGAPQRFYRLADLGDID